MKNKIEKIIRVLAYVVFGIVSIVVFSFAFRFIWEILKALWTNEIK
jgi:hypothetical protein